MGDATDDEEVDGAERDYWQGDAFELSSILVPFAEKLGPAFCSYPCDAKRKGDAVL